MQKKRCASCNELKELGEFYKDSRAADGLYSHCRDCHSVMAMRWAGNNIEKKRQIDRNCELRGAHAARKRRRMRERDECIAAMGGRCKCCGERRKEFLSIDHVNGGGRQHRMATKLFGGPLYRWLKANNYPVDFRLLCHNCNQSLGIYGYCPHEREKQSEGYAVLDVSKWGRVEMPDLVT